MREVRDRGTTIFCVPTSFKLQSCTSGDKTEARASPPCMYLPEHMLTARASMVRVCRGDNSDGSASKSLGCVVSSAGSGTTSVPFFTAADNAKG